MREVRCLKKGDASYACNLRMLQREDLAEKPTNRKERQSLNEEDDKRAENILKQFGYFDRENMQERVIPLTSNGVYGSLEGVKGIDLEEFCRKGKVACAETLYANLYYKMTNKSVYSNK
eukprot:snap_masked-scaffold_4-processed-gene-14.34-mRNA-1 protein AED:1.00 eAED:1.00 QI:0/-1/0/0/-1/1/1/0/118